jgi:drug/metabolite transporter (DMT)-like permease
MIIRLGDRISRMPYLLLTITTLCWAGNTVLARGMVAQLPPATLALWRWVAAALIMLPFAWRFLRRDWPLICRSWRVLSLIALSGVSCYNTFLYLGLRTTTAVNSALIVSASPVVIVLLSRLILGHRVRGLQAASLLLSLVGAVLIIVRGDLEALVAFDFVAGDLWVVAATVGGAFFSVLLFFRPAIHPVSLVTVTFCIGVVPLVPFYLWERGRYSAVELNPAVISTILYVALAPSILGFFCWNRGVELVGANRAGLFIFLTPVFVSILAWVFLGETLHWYHYSGMLMIFLGVASFTRYRDLDKPRSMAGY